MKRILQTIVLVVSLSALWSQNSVNNLKMSHANAYTLDSIYRFDFENSLSPTQKDYFSYNFLNYNNENEYSFLLENDGFVFQDSLVYSFDILGRVIKSTTYSRNIETQSRYASKEITYGYNDEGLLSVSKTKLKFLATDDFENSTETSYQYTIEGLITLEKTTIFDKEDNRYSIDSNIYENGIRTHYYRFETNTENKTIELVAKQSSTYLEGLQVDSNYTLGVLNNVVLTYKKNNLIDSIVTKSISDGLENQRSKVTIIYQDGLKIEEQNENYNFDSQNYEWSYRTEFQYFIPPSGYILVSPFSLQTTIGGKIKPLSIKRFYYDADQKTWFNLYETQYFWNKHIHATGISFDSSQKEKIGITNPFNQRLYIFSEDIRSFELYNNQGTKIKVNYVPGNQNIDTSQLDKGVYIYKITGGFGNQSGVLIKE